MKLSAEQKRLAKALNTKQLAFANLVIMKHVNKLSDANCYRKAGYNPRTDKSAESNASLLISNHKVSAYIDSFKLSSAEKVGLTLEFLDQQLFDMVKTDPSDYLKTVSETITVDGEDYQVDNIYLADAIENLPKSVLSSISTVKKTTTGIEFVRPDRKAIMELAYKRLGSLDGRAPHKIDIEGNSAVENIEDIIKKIASGEIPHSTADRVMKAVQLRADLIDQTEVQERLKRIEDKLNGV